MFPVPSPLLGDFVGTAYHPPWLGDLKTSRAAVNFSLQNYLLTSFFILCFFAYHFPVKDVCLDIWAISQSLEPQRAVLNHMVEFFITKIFWTAESRWIDGKWLKVHGTRFGYRFKAKLNFNGKFIVAFLYTVINLKHHRKSEVIFYDIWITTKMWFVRLRSSMDTFRRNTNSMCKMLVMIVDYRKQCSKIRLHQSIWLINDWQTAWEKNSKCFLLGCDTMQNYNCKMPVSYFTQ